MKRTLTIGLLLASLALGADSKDKQQQTPAKEKKSGTTSQSQKRSTESKDKTTSAPEMRPHDPLNPDPMRPGTPPTFPRTDPVPKKDPTPPATTKLLSFA